MNHRRLKNPLLDELHSFLISRQDGSLPSACTPMELASSPSGLHFPLTPAQLAILELTGISCFHPGDGPVRLSRESSAFCNEMLESDNESTGLWLPPGAALNTTGKNSTIEFESPINIILCIAGRRSGKTTIASVLMSWLAWTVLRNPDYIADIPLLPGSIISLLNMACDSMQARILFNFLRDNMGSLGLIEPVDATSDKIRIRNLSIESLSSSARSSRGRTAIGICLDEFAHFQRSGGPLADRTVWTAVVPSVASFGEKSLVVITTTPAGRSGVVWDLFSRRGLRKGLLTIQLPTWVMNPNISRSQLDEEFTRDENLARQEYGAEFLAPHGSFLNEDAVRACIGSDEDPSHVRADRHMHVDIGLRHDSTAIAIGFIKPERYRKDPHGTEVVIEHIEYLDPVSGRDVTVSEITRKIRTLGEKYNCSSVSFDQHQSAYISEKLKAVGYKTEILHATRRLNTDAWSVLAELVSSHGIILPGNERLISELSELEYCPAHDGFTVEAPHGKHDDGPDAVAMCVWFLVNNRSTSWTDYFNIIEEG